METFLQMTNAGTPDVLLTVTAAVCGADDGIIARYTDLDNYLLFQFRGDSGRVGLWRKEGGQYFPLDARLTPVRSGDVFAFRVSGTKLESYRNGQLVCGATDGFNRTATVHGLRQANAPDDVLTGFTVQPITGPPPPPPVLLVPAVAYYPDDPVYRDSQF